MTPTFVKYQNGLNLQKTESPHIARSSGVLGLAQQFLYGSPPPRRAGSSGVLDLASQLSGRKASSVRVDGALVDMDIGDLPFPDGPPPQTPLTKKAKASGGGLAGGGLADMGQQALGSVPTSDPLCLRSLSLVLSPITGIGLSQVSSMPDTPSPLRQTLQGTSDVLISSQPDYEQNTDFYGQDQEHDNVAEVVSPFVFKNPEVSLAPFKSISSVESHRASLNLPPQIRQSLETNDDLLASLPAGSL
jgi:hypothetical protein